MLSKSVSVDERHEGLTVLDLSIQSPFDKAMRLINDIPNIKAKKLQGAAKILYDLMSEEEAEKIDAILSRKNEWFRVNGWPKKK